MGKANRTPGRLAIFRAGTHTSVDGRTHTFSADDLATMAASYSQDVSPAPIVIGHPKLDAPAYGWAKRLVVDGDTLYAEPDQVEPQFAEMANAGRFKTISASLYLPGTPGNPTPGKPYLRHIGFLGAAAPAIKGLQHASFADGGEAAEFAMPVAESGNALTEALRVLRRLLDREAAEPELFPAGTAFAEPSATPHQEPKMPTEKNDNAAQAADFAEREQQLTTRETEIKAREAKLAEAETKARRTECAEFADALVADGKLLPRHKAPVVELLLALPADQPLEFAEGDTTVSKAPAEVLRGLLSDLPKQIDYAEKSADQGNPARAADFAAPAGTQVDSAQLELHAKARAYHAQHPDISFIQAVRAVGG